MAVDALIEKTKVIVDAKVESGEWSPRSIGWFRIDLDQYPELAVDQTGKPNQMITDTQYRRMVGFERQFDTDE